ncbi:MAG: glycosyltransferase family 87 protein [Parvularculaceae bacterium]
MSDTQCAGSEVNASPQWAEGIGARFPLFTVMATTRLKETLWSAALLLLLINAGVFAAVMLSSTGVVASDGIVKGGDFSVFKLAGDMVREGNFLAAYGDGAIPEMLRTHYPEADTNFELYWLYPPSMFFLVAALGFLPYFAAYGLWSGGSLALYAGVFANEWKKRLAIFLLLACPTTFQAIITGQTGLITASLLFIAAINAERRPILAGVAAGLLTVKPQLGLLIPVAFLASGNGRAFIAAALTAILIAALSTLIFGAESWTAFFDAARAQGARLNSDIFPFRKLVSPYGALSYLGAPAIVANGVQVAASLALAFYVGVVWRRAKDPMIKAAALLAAAPLASPYAFYYEMTIIAPAAFLIARHGLNHGWIAYEREMLAAAFALCLFLPGEPQEAGLPMPFLITALVFVIVARRALPAAGVRFATHMKPA